MGEIMKKRITLRQQFICAIFAAVIAIFAQLTIPLPFTAVPITMQVFAIILTGIILGREAWAISLLIYILLEQLERQYLCNLKVVFKY